MEIKSMNEHPSGATLEVSVQGAHVAIRNDRTQEALRIPVSVIKVQQATGGPTTQVTISGQEEHGAGLTILVDIPYKQLLFLMGALRVMDHQYRESLCA